MSAIVTHHYFAMQSLKNSQNHIIHIAKDNISSFRLGAQGPDFLYFNSFISNNKYSQLGEDIHKTKVCELFRNFCRFAYSKGDMALTSYLLGFATHYILDRNIHQFIQFICDETLSENYALDSSSLHKLCESELDNIVIENFIMADSKRFLSYSLLEINKSPLVAQMIKEGVWEVYGTRIAEKTINASIKSMRSAYIFLHDKNGGKLKEVQRMENILKDKKGVVSTLIRPVDRLDEDITNSLKKPWKYNSEFVNYTFFDVLEKSLEKSSRFMEHIYEACTRGKELPQELFTLNYLGK